jgi:hypothetical protein
VNHSIHSADRATHLKIVVVALVAGMAVAIFGMASRSNVDYTQNARVIKAGAPVAITSSGTPMVRWTGDFPLTDTDTAALGRLFCCVRVTQLPGNRSAPSHWKDGARDGARTRDLRRDRAVIL